MTRPIIVGFYNPYSFKEENALAPFPERSAGHRLWRMLADLPTIILGSQAFNASTHPSVYMHLFDRRNLFTGYYPVGGHRTWNDAARRMLPSFPQGSTVVLLGHDVMEAFSTVMSERLERVLIHPQVVDGITWRWLLHPSGRSTHYNDPAFRVLAGMLLADLITVQREVPTCRE
jgi:hypothetical protein